MAADRPVKAALAPPATRRTPISPAALHAILADRLCFGAMDDNPYRAPAADVPCRRPSQPVQSVAFLLAGTGTVLGSVTAHVLYRLPLFHAFGPADFRLKALVVMMVLMALGGGLGAFIAFRWTGRRA